MSQLSVYESMNELSRQMVQAAQQTDWDQLIALEQKVAELREALKRIDTQGEQAEAHSEPIRKRKVDIIKSLLADDREIRSYTDPWMDNVRHLLAGSARQRNVRNAYGVRR